jgi:hypothetical protein
MSHLFASDKLRMFNVGGRILPFVLVLVIAIDATHVVHKIPLSG